MVKFSKLTRVNLRKLKCGETLSEHGIIFDRLDNGDGRYTINIMVDSQRIHRVVGKESENVTRQTVEELIAKLRTDARQSRLNLPKGRKIVSSFKEIAEKYLNRQEQEGAKNLKSKRFRLKLHLIPFFSDMPLNKISSFDIERYKKFRLESKDKKDHSPKPSNINRELAVLSHLFSKAVEWEWLDKKPAINRFKEEQSRITYLTVEQIARLLEVAKPDQHPTIYLFILIGLETAMRRMEILSIKLADIDLDRCIIFIPQAKVCPRQQPITHNLADVLHKHLQTLPADQTWLFPAITKTGHTMNIEKTFRPVVKAAGFDPTQVVRHTLRHTAITHLVQAGVDLPTVKRISGHKTLQMVERYSHQNGTHIQAAMDRLEQRYRQVDIAK